MNQTVFGLTPAQLNLAFVAVIAAVAIGGVFAAGGPNQALDEGKQKLGLERSSSFIQSMQDATPAPQAETRCSTLAVGCTVTVVNTAGTGLTFRQGPGLGYPTFGSTSVLFDGYTVLLASGPVQADGYNWWEIGILVAGQDSGSRGWVAEGDGTTKWLAPTPECGPLQYYDPSQGCVAQNGIGRPEQNLVVATATCPRPSSGDSEMVISRAGDEWGSTVSGIDITIYWWLPTVTAQGTPVCLQQPFARIGWGVGPIVKFSCEPSEPYTDGVLGMVVVDGRREVVKITQTVRCDRYNCDDYPATLTDRDGQPFTPIYGVIVGDDRVVRCGDVRGLWSRELG